jgi:hypothetical protein
MNVTLQQWLSATNSHDAAQQLLLAASHLNPDLSVNVVPAPAAQFCQQI